MNRFKLLFTLAVLVSLSAGQVGVQAQASSVSLAEDLNEMVMDLDGVAYAGLKEIRIFFKSEEPRIERIEIDSRHQQRSHCENASNQRETGPKLVFDGRVIDLDDDLTQPELLFHVGEPVFLTSVTFGEDTGLLCDPDGDTVFRDKLEMGS